ncbi:MAG: PAS domain S-box protein [Pseudomonadota bacterium]
MFKKPEFLNWEGFWWGSEPDRPDDLEKWRSRFAKSMLAFGVVVFPLAMLFTVPLFISERRYGLIAADVAFWVFLVCQLFIFRFPPKTNKYVALAAIYFMTILFHITLGPFEVRPVWLVTCAVFSAIFLGIPGAIAAGLIHICLLPSLYLLMGPANPAWSAVYELPPNRWIVFLFNTWVLALASSLAVGFLLSRLDRALRDEQHTSAKMSRRGDELENANKRLKKEMSQREVAEEALVKSEEKYRLLAENAMDVIYTVDMDLNLTYISPSVLRVRGYTPEELMNMKLTDHLAPNSVETAAQVLAEELEIDAAGSADPKRSRTIELEVFRKDGSTYWSEASFTFIRNEMGQPIGILGVSRDISKRKAAIERLKTAEARHRAVLEASPDPIVTYDMEGRTTYVNPAFTSVFGWTEQELLGRKIDFVPEEELPKTRKLIKMVLAGRSSSGVETRRRTKSGKIIEISLSAAVFNDPEGRLQGSVAILQDITERKRLEAQLMQILKMEAIGTLAGGIAHDFNNLLMGIQGRTSLLDMELGSSHPQKEHIEAIEEYVQGATQLTKQLLGFARGGKYETKPIDMNTILVASAEMFGRTHKEIQIHKKLEVGPLVVVADRGQIEQVLLNIFINAWQAMPVGGHIYVETALVSFNEPDSEMQQIEPGLYVKTSITDTGVGMDEATQQRIFDPFFTTKEKGRGTGLGLASAYGIIRNHHGKITTNSEVGHGSTFNIYLPASDSRAEIVDTEESVPVQGSETILLVDDEKMIQEVGCAMLEKLGYRVFVATNGQEAIEIVVNQGNSINLVILDLIMPGIDGGKAFEKIRRINPTIPIILSSGYAINGQATEIMNQGCDGFLQKPFKIFELSKKIRLILDTSNV